MAHYRLQRNIEASLINYIKNNLTIDNWHCIRVEKSFANAYDGELPCIVVMAENRPYTRIEIGSKQIFQDVDISIRIFATNDGLRLDLSDWLLDKLLEQIDYYEYIVIGNDESSELSGKINIIGNINSKKELLNSESLSDYDKYRHIFTFTCRVEQGA